VYGSAFLAGHALSEAVEPLPRNTYARSKWVGAAAPRVYGSAFLAGHALSEAVEPLPRNTYARSKWVGAA
ncbi:hypothetical protein CTI14_72020, partial [Methylobacterium radiotolerans]